MRTLASALMVGVLCIAACKQSEKEVGVPLAKAGDISSSEMASLVAIHPALGDWRPHSSVRWDREGIVRHVCLGEAGVGSLFYPCEVFGFDTNGTVVDANLFWLPSDGRPEALMSTLPLRIRCRTKAGLVVLGVAYSPGEGLREIHHRCEAKRLVSEWHLSGRTNLAELFEQLHQLEAGKPLIFR